MTRILAIDPGVKAAIDRATELARARPVPFEALQRAAVEFEGVMTLDKRKPGFERTQANVHVLIPYGFDAAITFEQQPPGLCKHLSISVDNPGRLPSPEAVTMIAAAFEISIATIVSQWIEEFAPGQLAVNIVALDSFIIRQGRA